MALPMKAKMVEIKSFSRCEMCGDSKMGARWEFRFQQMLTDYIPEQLLICRKCIYRELYGTKHMNKAKKAKALDKFDYEFNSAPKDF